MAKSVRRAAVEVRALEPIHEHELVRITRDLEAEGYHIAKNTAGTVVGIYDDGAAYAVEISELPGGPDVVTLKAGQVERIH